MKHRIRPGRMLVALGCGAALVVGLLMLAACTHDEHNTGLLHSSGVAGLASDSAHGAPGTATPAAVSLPTTTVTVEEDPPGVTLNVEIASTEAQRDRGLMFRESLSDSSGMLFLFPAPTTLGFWMKDTYIPLDIAFLDDLGRVMQVVHGKPLDTTPLVPSAPYTSVLEVAGGWFERMGLGVGATVHIPPGLPSPD